jgi:hypothetical protein
MRLVGAIMNHVIYTIVEGIIDTKMHYSQLR